MLQWVFVIPFIKDFGQGSCSNGLVEEIAEETTDEGSNVIR